ncbi:MAG: hypothetical protein Ct9H300mP19_13330 [Dehalococcoidia bacterium]|nr:MAG: hypothetical protein Ct9H300mP19_13330 [Dehalococcoidia bacterium]
MTRHNLASSLFQKSTYFVRFDGPDMVWDKWVQKMASWYAADFVLGENLENWKPTF